VTHAAFACAIVATGTRGGSERMVNDMVIEDRQQLDEDMRAVSWPGRPTGVRR
jgi:hypothetical protein